MGAPEVSVTRCVFIFRQAGIQVQAFREQMTTPFAADDFEFVLHGSLLYSGERAGARPTRLRS